MKFRYNQEKNVNLLNERGIGFEEIIQEIADGNLLCITSHHNIKNYPTQKIMHVRVLNQVYIIPYITEEDGTIFLKTLYPSRKATNKHLGRK